MSHEALLNNDGIDFVVASRISELSRWARDIAEQGGAAKSGYWARMAARAAFTARPDLRWPDDVPYGHQLTLVRAS